LLPEHLLPRKPAAKFDLQRSAGGRVHVFCGATNAARVEIFQLFGSKRMMTANQRSKALPLGDMP
jgi:hypothetical protein